MYSDSDLLQFGAAVLIDPFWNVDGLVQRRTKQFPRLLERFEEEVLNQHLKALPRHQEQARSALLAITTCLASNDTLNFVTTFLESYPPQLPEPKNDEEDLMGDEGEA